MGPYLEESAERSLKLSFQEVGAGDMDDLRRDLDVASSMLRTDPEELRLPQKGFLVEELTTDQRTEINRVLSSLYARVNSEEQQKLQRNIHITESNESMTSVMDVVRKAGVHVSITDSKFHEACGEYARGDRIWYARRQVVDKLIAVVRVFNHIGLQPHLEDCFRPPQVQEGLLFRRIAGLAQQYRDWKWEDVRTVGGSLTAPVPGLAGHQAGAAIDLRLKDDKSQFLALGNDYAESGVIGCINCPYITLEQYKTRMRFAHIMRMGGFRLLPTENWHVSYGDRGMGIDGHLSDHQAVYGPIKSFDRKTGVITPYESDMVDKPYLSKKEVEKLVSLSRQIDPCEYDEYVMTSTEAVSTFREWLLRHRTQGAVQSDSFSVSNDDEGEL